MSARVCSEAGCGRLVEKQGPCPEHAREREQARGTRQERGYGAAHDALRRRWAPKVALGRVDCSRCGERIRPGEPWHLDHDSTDRSRYLGPSHESCNAREPRTR